MTRWTRRPGKLLALVQVAALWPLWIGVLSFDRVLRMTPSSDPGGIWVFRISAAVVALCALFTYVGRHPPDLVASARRGLGPMAHLIGIGLTVALLGLRWRAPELDAMVVSSVASALGGVLYLALAAVAARWPAGVLRRGQSAPFLQGEHCRYVLGEWPGECEPGETLRLPDFELTLGVGGPYRRGRVLGHSATVVRDRDGRLIERLVHHGVLLEVWALTTLCWVALGRVG